MSLLIYLHVVFNQKPVTCLSHLHDVWPRQGVLRVELFFQTPPEEYTLEQSYAKEYQNTYLDHHDNEDNEHSLPVAEILVDPSPHNHSFEETHPNMSINFSLLPPDNSLNEILSDTPIEQSEDDDDDDNESLFNFDWIKQLLIEEQHILEYSLEYGFLRLSPQTRKRLNIEVLLVTLGKSIIWRELSSKCLVVRKDVTNNTCFGSGLSRFILDQFIGYQEILMSSVKQLAEKETHKGKNEYRISPLNEKRKNLCPFFPD